MPLWWGKLSSKEGNNKKGNKQQKLKTVYEEKCNDNLGAGSRRQGSHHAETIPERRFDKSPIGPSRSLSPSSKFVTSCFTSFTTQRSNNNVDESLPFPSQGLHLPYYRKNNDNANSGRQKLEITRDSNSSLNFPLPKTHHVSSRRELELEDLDTSSHGSSGDGDIIFDDPIFLSRHPRQYQYENGNKIAPYRTIKVMPKHQLPPVTHDGRQQRQQILPVPTSNGTTFCNANTGIKTPSPKNPGSGTSSRWKKGKFLGRGSYGQVFAGFNIDKGYMCAMKEVTLCPDDPKSKECAKQLTQEIALLSHLRHPNIVGYYGSETVDDKLYIYLEYCGGGSIYKVLQKHGGLNEVNVRNYTRQILLGLQYLHAQHTVHRDIKGANILVDSNGNVKLADFGVAKQIGEGACPFSLKGSPHWMAPEVIKSSEGCNQAVDIWSLGCTVLEMLTTKPPWSQLEGVAAMFKIAHTDQLPPIPERLSDEGKYFINLCLQRDPKNRPSATQLLQHPFVMSITTLLERPIHQQYVSERMSPSPTPRYASSHIASRTSSLSPRSGLNNAAAMPTYQTQGQIYNPYAASGLCSLSPRTGGSNTSHRTGFSPNASGVIQRSQSGLRSKERSNYKEPGRHHDPYVMQSSFKKKDVVGSHNKMTIQGGGAVKSRPPDLNAQSVLRNHVRRN